MDRYNLVDKERYSNAARAILYELTLLRTENPFDTLMVLLIPFAGFFFSLNLEEPIGHTIGMIVSALGFLLPFFFSFINYYSEISISGNEYKISCFSLTYRRGKVSDFIEIHQLSLYQGCYRVRTSGLGEASGFMLFYSYVPDFFKELKVIDLR